MNKALMGTLVAGLGGFVGTCLRFLSELIGTSLTFPIGTFIANMAGCFLIGLFYGWALKANKLSKMMNLFLITGVCGGLTTFSSLSDECVNLLKDGQDPTFWLYLLSTLILGLILVVVGILCVRPSASLVSDESKNA